MKRKVKELTEGMRGDPLYYFCFGAYFTAYGWMKDRWPALFDGNPFTPAKTPDAVLEKRIEEKNGEMRVAWIRKESFGDIHDKDEISKATIAKITLFIELFF